MKKLSNSAYKDMIRYMAEGARAMTGGLRPEDMRDSREHIETGRRALLLLVDLAIPKRKYRRKKR